jgi:hypothetical protein
VARPPFAFAYMLLPQYTPIMAPLWENSDVTEQLDLGALAVAHDTLELVRATESRRRRATGSRMRALLDGKLQLPPLHVGGHGDETVGDGEMKTDATA